MLIFSKYKNAYKYNELTLKTNLIHKHVYKQYHKRQLHKEYTYCKKQLIEYTKSNED